MKVCDGRVYIGGWGGGGGGGGGGRVLAVPVRPGPESVWWWPASWGPDYPCVFVSLCLCLSLRECIYVQRQVCAEMELGRGGGLLLC